MTNTNFTNDKRKLPFGHSAAIIDEFTITTLHQMDLDLPKILYGESLTEQFCLQYIKWIKSTTCNTVYGLDGFPFYTYSNGTSEAFDKFYMRNRTRRFRCFKAEYLYHQLAWRNSWPDWKYIEDDDIKPNDAVVISLPFADTGDKHKLHDQILNLCDQLGVPVLIDCAYFGISSDIIFDFDYSCITDVVFSLSKTFPVAHARIGMRLTRIDDDDSMFVYHKSLYNNRIGAAIGTYFLDRYSPSYIPDKYKSRQHKFCNYLKITPSKTVLFGTATDTWLQYNRGGETNRLSLHKFLHLETLQEFINEFKG
jgi:hypothetical protein